MSEIVSLQYLRGIAAMLVVALHSATPLPAGYDLTFGNIGVDIFFVISGFVMWLTTFERPTGTLRFLGKRVLRIVPLYWSVTLFIAFFATDPIGLRVTEPIPDILKSLFFIPFYSPNTPGEIYPILFVGWTLNVEMMFYLIFAICLPLPPLWRFLAASAGLFCLVGLGLAFDIANATFQLMTDSIVGIFIFGMGLGVIYTRSNILFAPGKAFALVTGLGLLALVVRDTGLRFFDYGLPSLVLVTALLACERWLRRHSLKVMKLLGDASYSIYLVHPIALKLVNNLLGPHPFGLDGLLAFGLLVIFSAVSGIFVYWLYERPLTKLMKRLFSGRRPGASDTKNTRQQYQ